jgi:hypothetical protein
VFANFLSWANLDPNPLSLPPEVLISRSVHHSYTANGSKTEIGREFKKYFQMSKNNVKKQYTKPYGMWHSQCLEGTLKMSTSTFKKYKGLKSIT